MATSPSDPRQTDRLSNLPDALLVTILSLLPTRMAARTCVLCRRFRHLGAALWETSPSLDLISQEFSPEEILASFFEAMGDRALLRRSPSHPLLSLRIELEMFFRFPPYETKYPFLHSLCDKARSLAVRHLTLEGCLFWSTWPSLSLIFSTDSLQSLSLSQLYVHWHQTSVISSGVTLINLKNLSIGFYTGDPTKLNLLLSQLPSLEVLSIGHDTTHPFSISSQTIRQLKLTICMDSSIQKGVHLSLPSLELLHVENYGFGLPHIRADIPSLRKAVLHLNWLHQKDCITVSGLLNSISHAEELILHLKESDREMYPFPILLEEGKDPPKFSNLKHLEVTMCFHEHNFEAIVSLLHHSPALESVKLVHKAPFSMTRKRKMDGWRSMLPQNADGNCNYVHFTNLHLGQQREFMKLVGKKFTPKMVELHC
ncbi:hypothetical protein LUZ61_013327 [Rhynchospora tenuis]|uniref:F-box domain-containing protein n=1 Tax=Rhynchospora tenuis TaxID=198213 RepID=A0AAD5WAD5_9POAL|nr:hypothetical protein LUZ61_013327 [Rhynchospora tenuis]